MLFNDPRFVLFVAFTLLLYFTVVPRLRRYVLLALSYFFYGMWNWKFLSVLFALSVVDYYCGLMISRTADPKWRKRLLIISILFNFGALGFFKYYNFFADNLFALLGGLGIKASLPILNIVLPVGISFHVFQSVSYTIDVYRGQTRACRSLIDFLLFVAYFPQLVAGPIERAQHLLPQLQNLKNPTRIQIVEGLCLCLSGFLKKVVIGDSIAPFVDRVFSNYGTLSSHAVLTGVIAFSLQIYFDFSGYSEIAKGVSKFFGVNLIDNFNGPYMATNITEFWRRWHISLSNWLRDYLYIPLGGNRKGRVRTYINLMVTMLLGGLWHGANWTFVFWGALHGAYLSAHKLLMNRVPSGKFSESLGSKVAGSAFTFVLVLFAWIFFRSPDMKTGFAIVGRILHWSGPLESHYFFSIFALFGFLLAFDLPRELSKDRYVWLRLNKELRFALGVAAILLVALMMFVQTEARPFIYFQF